VHHERTDFCLVSNNSYGDLGETTVEQLLAWAIAYANPQNGYHDFGKRCAVELLCRDQFKRDDAAHQALTQMEPKIREVYGVYI
jgi:hypothetical protein